MRYLGGKSKIARKTAAAILGHTPRRGVLVEPFVGGGAMTEALSPAFELTVARDTHEDLVLLFQALQSGWVPPEHVTETEYAAHRECPVPSALRGFVGFGASFGGKWFGGYARGGERNYASESARSLARQMQAGGNVVYLQGSYADAFVQPGWVVYCDPPYVGTTGYKDAFCPTTFWRKADAWAAMGAQVYVSEYQAPAHWTPIWEETRTRDMRSDLQTAQQVTERLFVPRSAA